MDHVSIFLYLFTYTPFLIIIIIKIQEDEAIIVWEVTMTIKVGQERSVSFTMVVIPKLGATM